MPSIHTIWDSEDDADGNVERISEHGVSQMEVDEVLHSALSNTTTSKSSGHRITFGYTTDGRYLAVVWEHVLDDPLTAYPITAYDAPEPRRSRK